MERKDTPLPSTDELTPVPSTEIQENGKNEEYREPSDKPATLESIESLENQENPESPTITLTEEAQASQEVEEAQASQEDQEAQASTNEAEATIPLITETEVEDNTRWHLPVRSEDISEDDYQAASAIISTIEREITAGAISNETIAQLLKSVVFDRSVAIAHHEGEVAGRNQRIDEYMQERRKEKELPDLGRSPIQPRPTLPYTMIGGLSAADRKSIWERGNEKRHRKYT